MSVCEIETSETYEKGRPKRGGLSDPRMGTMDRAMKCETDGMSSTDTPGYFGHLELAKPVYHHGFINNLVKVLRCVGFSSSKLLIDKVSVPRPRVFSTTPPHLAPLPPPSLCSAAHGKKSCTPPRLSVLCPLSHTFFLLIVCV